MKKNTDSDDELPVDSNIEQLKQFITNTYNTTGTRTEKEFVTTQELLYELSEMIECTQQQLIAALNELQITTQSIDGLMCWVLYREINL